MLTTALSFWIVELIVKIFALPNVLFHRIQLQMKVDNCQRELMLVHYFAQNRVFNTWCYNVLQAHYSRTLNNSVWHSNSFLSSRISFERFGIVLLGTSPSWNSRLNHAAGQGLWKGSLACSMKAEREKDNLEQYEAIIGASEWRILSCFILFLTDLAPDSLA
jgi:hypothetical protein